MADRIALEQTALRGWECWCIRRGPLELILLPQIGGRIIGLRWRGQDLFFTQPEREGTLVPLDRQEHVLEQKRALGFPLWGGDKTWLAPQAAWTLNLPFIDLDSGPYALQIQSSGPNEVRVAMISEQCRETGIRLTRTISVTNADDTWSVTHEMHNEGPSTVTWALWDVAMVTRPATVYLPTSASSAYEDGVRTYAEEGQSTRVRGDVLGHLDGLATIRCREPIAFKFGVDASAGWIAAVIESSTGALIGYHKQVPFDSAGTYAHGCIAEVYNSDGYPYLELELQSPLTPLAPGQRHAIVERQRVSDVARWPQCEQDVRALGEPAGLSGGPDGR